MVAVSLKHHFHRHAEKPCSLPTDADAPRADRGGLRRTAWRHHRVRDM